MASLENRGILFPLRHKGCGDKAKIKAKEGRKEGEMGVK